MPIWARDLAGRDAPEASEAAKNAAFPSAIVPNEQHRLSALELEREALDQQHVGWGQYVHVFKGDGVARLDR
jgi:hypothetical protein